MAYPGTIPTRDVVARAAFVLETGQAVLVRLTWRASRSLRWDATGQLLEHVNGRRTSGAGADVTVTLPCTDQLGWRDADTGALIDVSGGAHSHTYAGTVDVLTPDVGAVLASRAIAFVVPAGAGALYLDQLTIADSTTGILVPLTAELQQLVDAAAAELDGKVSAAAGWAGSAGQSASDAAGSAAAAAVSAMETVVVVSALADWSGPVALSQADTRSAVLHVVLVGDAVVTLAAGVSGVAYSCTLAVRQDATGGRALVLKGVAAAEGLVFPVPTGPNENWRLRLEWDGLAWTGYWAGRRFGIPSAWA